MGNKSDLDAEGKREVPYERGKVFAESLGIDFIEVSAKSSTNVDKCFQRMVECIDWHDEVFFFFFFLFFFFSFFWDQAIFEFFFNRIKRSTYILHVRMVVRKMYLVCWPKRLTWKPGIL